MSRFTSEKRWDLWSYFPLVIPIFNHRILGWRMRKCKRAHAREAFPASIHEPWKDKISSVDKIFIGYIRSGSLSQVQALYWCSSVTNEVLMF